MITGCNPETLTSVLRELPSVIVTKSDSASILRRRLNINLRGPYFQLQSLLPHLGNSILSATVVDAWGLAKITD
jgi:hypothetical protein